MCVCVCVMGIEFVFVSTIFLLDIGSVYVLFFDKGNRVNKICQYRVADKYLILYIYLILPDWSIQKISNVAMYHVMLCSSVIEQNNYYHFVKEFYINLIDIQFCYRYYLLIYKYWHRLCSLWQIHIRCTTGATSGAGTTYPSGAPEFTPDF
jgi:hypothetical protein